MTEHKKPVIMLVEDEDRIRHMLIGFLQKINCQVDDYSNGLEADEQLAVNHATGKSKHYNLILSDIDMPEMDGLAFAKRAHVLAPESPLILMTGKPRENYPDNVQTVMHKPFGYTELKQTVEKYLKHH
jgi:CheY-like chemotaxis protein